ncbi:MAG TPA: glycosyltransferase [Chitinophagaceae bacterium]|nr:glycosyltransferase [Chitinophagaceae bacterium]
MKKPFNTVSAPSRKELITLRLMIFIGIGSMGYLLYCLFNRAQISFAPFYWVLMFAITFSCLRLLHEWYHYFSISIPRVPEQKQVFTVDIFTTFCPGEPYEMIVETLTALQKIHYPHTTYLCDEANDPYLKKICQQLGVHHITRNNRKDAKAGNINNALQYATGDLCVILDPDHVPQPEFLDPIVPHFNNPEIGFVQIVQAYSNLDDTLIAKGAAQQTFQFYGPIMMTMNSYGTVLAIGANCTFRRAALDSIGGHAAGLAEDMHTAMQLHAKGWKSVYVPAVLARGLVPSTLSAYYAQQLKWSRGTFELLFATYPRLFLKFNWRQKLHYGTIPLYYLSGLISLINFIIPILSLCTGLIPFRVDMVDFLLLGMPMIASSILIRQYVQRWVMEEKERGFHVVGGLLQIGTWWIYMTGLVYTIFRKKVPYIPTPKDNKTPDHWSLNLPNTIMVIVTLAAIIYGLNYDWNPYAWVMAGIAAINCLILSFVILISQQTGAPRLRDKYEWIRKALVFPLSLKRKFWLLRHTHIYSGFRKLGLPLLILTVSLAWYFLKVDAKAPSSKKPVSRAESTVFYTGIYQPGKTEGLISMQDVQQYQQQYKSDFNILSLYIPWGNAPQNFLNDSLMKAIYENGSIPMITWEPWASVFPAAIHNKELQNDQKVFAHISAGFFDSYLEKFALQVKSLDKPVFIRFAHEADNPDYPWSPKGNNTPEEFKTAWKYVYTFFLRRGVANAIWVWNPWKAEQVENYFPGKEYVDWLSVTNLNYGPQLGEGAFFSFKDLYMPFHRQPAFQSGLPVMIGEMGSLAIAGRQEEWFNTAFRNINTDFREIQAMIFFNTAYDSHILKAIPGNMLDWRMQYPDSIFSLLKKYPRIDSSRLMPSYAKTGLSLKQDPVTVSPHRMPEGIRGTNYHKGENWYRNFHELTRHEISKDFREMKELGINTIRRFGPGVYDRNILAVAKELDMQIDYAFWLPSVKDMNEDQQELIRAEYTILKRVKELRNEPRIIAWSIGNTILEQLAQQYDKPALLYQQSLYLNWLNQLFSKIKAIDNTRPVTIDVNLAKHLPATLSMLHQQLPLIDAFGLIVENDSTGVSQLKDIDVPYFISQISADHYIQTNDAGKRPVFITDWQDQQTRDYVTFDGLIDHWGRYKPAYYVLKNSWASPSAPHDLPEIKILRPAKTTFKGTNLTYHVLVRDKNIWRFPPAAEDTLRFEWHLVKIDEEGNAIYLKHLGSGPNIELQIPERPEYYRLYVQVVKDNSVNGVQSTLNTPLQPEKPGDLRR